MRRMRALRVAGPRAENGRVGRPWNRPCCMTCDGDDLEVFRSLRPRGL
jgi:hypothetical protein